MTPDDYLNQLKALFTSERYAEALAFSERLWTDVHPSLPLPELEQVFGMMEVAATIVRTETLEQQTAATTPTTPRDG
jgi:hypothetical protein